MDRRYIRTKAGTKKRDQRPKGFGMFPKGSGDSEEIWYEGAVVCEYLNISRSTLYRYRQKKILPHFQFKRKFFYRVFDDYGELIIAPSKRKEKRP